MTLQDRAANHRKGSPVKGARDDRFHRLLDQIYDAAFDRSAFLNLPRILTDVMQAANSVVILSNSERPVDVAATSTQKAQQDYLAYYQKIDIWKPPQFGVNSFVVSRTQSPFSDREVINSEFYRDYARHLDMWNPMGVSCMLNPDLSLMIGVNRARGAKDFNREAEAFLIDIAHHVQRALQIGLRFKGVETRAQAGFAVLNQLAFAAVVADADGRVMFANTRAEELHRSDAGLVLHGGKLVAAVPQQAKQLSALVRSAATNRAGGAIALSDCQGLGVLLTQVSPLPSRLREDADGPALALVTFRPSGESAAFTQAIFQQLFGLSPAEAHVVCAIAAGATLEEIAAQRGVKMTTIKTQLEAAFRKTGAENQRDLLRIVGALPQLR